MKTRSICRLAACFLVVLLVMASGCLSSDDEELTVSSAAQGVSQTVAAVGLDACVVCHERQAGNAGDEWLSGQHGNLASHGPGSGTLDSQGFPDYGYFYEDDGTPRVTENGFFCYDCHDPLGDGYRLEEDLTGNQHRPVIGCESCHGGGAEHYGAGQIPHPKPEAEQCGRCHSEVFPPGHLPHHPNADDIYEDYIDSPHPHSINEHTIADEATGAVRARCGRCHTDEGYRMYARLVPGTEGHDAIVDFFELVPPIEDPSSVTCRTCHDPHEATGDELERIEDDRDSHGNPESRQFNTCTNCHQLVKEDGSPILADGNVPDTYHAFRHGTTEIAYDRNIVDTHAARPGDPRLNTGADAQTLYFVKKDSGHSCAMCHNPHNPDPAINRQWASSGHGDPLAEAWVHYDWKHSSRSACQRCHTTTGFMKFASTMAAGSVYDPADNDFSYLAGNDSGSRVDDNDQMEALYCWGCHAVSQGSHAGGLSYKGELRDPGAHSTTVLYDNAPFSGEASFPDASGSNVCISCHSGRENGAALMSASIDWSSADLSFTNSHYLAAAGVLYRQAGYEYYPHESGSGPDYSNVPYFEHDLIGSTVAGHEVAEATGLNGPCAGCHMHGNEGDEKHTFSPVKHEGGEVELVSESCSACHHSPYIMTGNTVAHEEELYEASVHALGEQLAANGFPYLGHYPYFSASDWTLDSTGASHKGTGSQDRYGRNNMGAAFNFNLLHHEPGAFAHNRYYTKRLIYDSIDWLDNNAMDQSVASALPLILSGSTLGRAEDYLLDDGGRP